MEKLSPEAKALLSSIEELFKKGVIKITNKIERDKYDDDVVRYYPTVIVDNKIVYKDENFIQIIC